IKGTGQVGIGIITPMNKLDINSGATRTGTHATGLPLYVTGVASPASGGAEFRHDNGTQGIGIGYNTIYAAGSDANHNIGLTAKGATGLLLFTTNTNERVRINGSGDMGVGMNNPLNRLDIANGAARTGTHATGRPLYITGTLSDASNGVEIRHADGAQGIGLGRNTIYAAGSDAVQNLGLAAKGATGNLLFTTNSVERIRINGSGDIGVGINNPLNKLDIAAGPARTGTHPTGLPFYVTGIVGPASGGAEFRHANGTQGIGIGYSTIYAAGSNVDQHLALSAKGTAGHLQFLTNNTEKVRITADGQVGIGVTTPHAQLQLATTVANRKIILYEVADNDHQFHGFGIDGFGSLRYQTANTLNDHVFVAATSSTNSNELMRIKGDGNVVISGVIETEAFIEPTLLNNFTNYELGHATAAFYKDKMGRVYLRGLVKNVNNPTGLVIFTLPAGYRPSMSGKLIFATLANNNTMGRIDVQVNGDVVVDMGSAGWISLENISFRAD
ncbi:MAG TPA: hypothetical protein VGK46_12485, partial [Saprospiraceae bacterium]